MFAMLSPGPLELIIIAVIGLGMLVVPVVLVVALVAANKKKGPLAPGSSPCPQCGGWLVPQAKFCHHCGNALAPPPSPFKQ